MDVITGERRKINRKDSRMCKVRIITRKRRDREYKVRGKEIGIEKSKIIS